MTTLLIAANRKQKGNVCTEVLVGITGSGEQFYIEKEDVLKIIQRGGTLVNKPLSSIDLSALEASLERNSWIREAELYVDSRNALHVLVEERDPIARVFTVEGNSFYIDSSGHRMPLLDKVSVRVPVVTGYPDKGKGTAWHRALFEEVKEVAQFIYHDAFWNAQIGQIDITAEKKFELVPVIGNHIIKLGDGHRVDEKLGRLHTFYRQVMNKVGFNRYAVLDVRFDGQVVGINKGTVSTVDSLQLQKNIEELVNRATLQQVEDDMLPVEQEVMERVKDTTVSTTVRKSVPVKTNAGPGGEER